MQKKLVFIRLAYQFLFGDVQFREFLMQEVVRQFGVCNDWQISLSPVLLRWATEARSAFPCVFHTMLAETPAGLFSAIVHRLTYNGDVVAFKMGRRQGARRAHI
jgi:hypothetical protein